MQYLNFETMFCDNKTTATSRSDCVDAFDFVLQNKENVFVLKIMFTCKDYDNIVIGVVFPNFLKRSPINSLRIYVEQASFHMVYGWQTVSS